MSHLGKTASGQDTPPRANPTQFVKEKSEKVKAKSVSQKKAFFIMLITTRECFAAATAKSLQLCLTLCDPHRRQPNGLPGSWDSPGKNTAVGCHFLLQCMKVKSESEVAESCLTLSNPMDCSLPGSSIHGIFQARVLEWGAIAFSERML